MKSEVPIVASLALLYALRMLGLFMVLPVLFLYGESYTAASAITLGLALGAYGLAQALFQIPLGLLSDIVGRKPIIVFGLLLFACGSIIAAMSDSVYGLILGRVLQGSGAIASTIMALVADLTQEQNRSKAMAAIGASIGLSFMVSLILGPALAAQWGLSGVFMVSFVLSLLGILVLLFGVPSSKNMHPAGREVGAVPALIKQSFFHLELARLNFGIFALHATLTAMFVSVPSLLVEFGVTQENHTWVYLPVMLFSFVIAVPLMMAFERRGKAKEIFVAAILLIVASLVVLGFGSHLPLFIAALFLFFVAFNLLEAMLPSTVSKLAPAGTRGTAMGVYSTSQFLGAFVGGLLGGLVVFHWGSSTLFYLSALLCLLWFVCALRMSRPQALKGVSYAVEPSIADLDLLAIKGVEEVVYIQEDQLVYLKIDPSCVDEEALQTSIAPYLTV